MKRPGNSVYYNIVLIGIGVVLFFKPSALFSQVSQEKGEIKKLHFMFQFGSQDCDTLLYYNAINAWPDIERYRLINNRRYIPVIKNLKNEEVTLILFSAMELKNKYNREIHVDNLPDEKEREAVIVIDEQTGRVKYVKQ